MDRWYAMKKYKRFLLVILALSISFMSFSLYADNSILYKINELRSTDFVFKNFVSDSISSKRYTKVRDGISVQDMERYGSLPKFKLASYEIKESDNIVDIAKSLYLDPETLISVNKLTHISQFKVGENLLLPNMKGVLHTISDKTTIREISDLYDVSPVVVMYVNGMFSGSLFPNEDVFIPNGEIEDFKVEDFLGRVFLIPLANNPVITSPYGMRDDPFTGKRTMHYGIDYRASVGTDVFASQYGVVTKTGYSGGYGKYVVITHKNKYKTYYGHLSKISVKKNQFIQTGEKIAETGNTGRSTGPHLHFEIRYNNKPTNPEKMDNFGKEKPSFLTYLKTQKEQKSN